MSAWPTEERLRGRVLAARAYAEKRIEQCRRDEDKFARLEPGRPSTGYPSVVLEAVAERFALTHMLAILAGDDS